MRTFKNCEGLSGVAFMDGNGVVTSGKVISCQRKESCRRRQEEVNNCIAVFLAATGGSWPRTSAKQRVLAFHSGPPRRQGLLRKG